MRPADYFLSRRKPYMGSVFASRYWMYTCPHEVLFSLSKDEYKWFKLLVDEAMKG